jgi:hypothetical protein
MKTNITVASNIFNRADRDVRRDPNFMANVIGRPALQKLKNQYGGSFRGIGLSTWQEKMYNEDKGCYLARNGEKTHGLVRKDGNIVWEGRCEYSQCEQFATCSETAHFHREKVAIQEITDRDVSPLTYKWLGDIEELFQEQEIGELPLEEVAPPDVIIADVKAFVAQDDYEKINNPIRIIEDDIESKILVNAAPGSGKTYTVIRRLEHIIRNRLLDDFSSVLVLVYTNAAKSEILARLESGVIDGTLPYSARSIDICTFDSLATSYLAAIEAPFAHLDYNGRIMLFNEKFLAENFSNFRYVIVDELQDLVNARAKMVLNILGALQGGYLLLGDKCQAIYDYDCHDGDNVSSVEFYKRLGELLPNEVKKYELVGNQRQVDRLATISNKLRCALLGFDPPEANELIADELKSIRIIDSVERYDFCSITKRTAILCRNNGEAEYVSHLLHKKRVPHTLLRSIGQTTSLQRFIADCLWDYLADTHITRSVFIGRYCARIVDDEKTASKFFDALSEAAYDDVREAIEIEKLAQALNKPAAKLPAVLLNEDNALLTVSTIHKAKGREFDTVFLLDSGFTPTTDNTEEARVWYVGCTRAKTNLFKLTKATLYLRRSSTYSSRWMQLNNHRVRWTHRLLLHCRNIVLGLPMDFLEAGFVRGDFSTALKAQEYIAEKVKIGDTVDVELVSGKYQVRHSGHIIGCLSENMFSQLLSIVRESNPASGAPPYLSFIYVSNIITITPTRFPDGVIPYFRESRFWLGLELTGFPKINWHYTQSDETPTNNCQ